MTTATLTDRYVDAAMRTVPETQRDDLAAELRGSIDDQIEARLAEGEDHASAERAVLTDLGNPTSSPRSTPTGRCGSSGRATSSTGGGC